MSGPSSPITALAGGVSAGIAGLGGAGLAAGISLANRFQAGQSDASNSQYYQQSLDLAASTRANILSADIGDEQRQQLLSQIDAINTDRGEVRFAALKPIIDTLATKNALSGQVAKLYQSAIANASKLQSTVITQGGAAQVTPAGNSSIITGGTK